MNAEVRAPARSGVPVTAPVEAHWLDDLEQATWRRWLRAHLLLAATLQREMAQQSGMSMQDFEVLVLLTDSPDQRLRISKLALGLQWEKSRLSHHLARMVRRGLVTREGCSSDGRGAFIAVTPAGREAIEAAAPSHVQLVREVFFESMSSQDQRVIDGFLDKLLSRMEDDPTQVCAEPESTLRP